MTNTQKEKLFLKMWKDLTTDWIPRSKKGFYNLYRCVWMAGFQAGYENSEEDMKKRAEPLLKKFGI